MKALVAGLAALVPLAVPGLALACELADGFDPWQPDPAEVGVDAQPPSAPGLYDVEIVRAVQPLLPSGLGVSEAP